MSNIDQRTSNNEGNKRLSLRQPPSYIVDQCSLINIFSLTKQHWPGYSLTWRRVKIILEPLARSMTVKEIAVVHRL